MTTPALELRSVDAGYAATPVLDSVTITVAPGSVVALLGPNGAGKTTTLRVASGALRATAGSVLLGGVDVSRHRPSKRARAGLCLIPEGRGVFPALTVRENLRLLLPSWGDRATVDDVLDVFPILRDKLDQRAGAMSGGQQQMLALARAWLAEPRVVLLDEVSMGLAPLVVEEIFVSLDALRQRGVALLLVEQYVDRALALADRVYLLARGRTVLDGRPDELDRESVLQQYLGMGNAAL